MSHEEGKFQPTRPGAEFLSETEIRNYCKQLVDAVAELHSKKIMHLDLKPQNVLLSDENEVKLADFGSA